jgi:GNAT superfamily N-acetyltransferase
MRVWFDAAHTGFGPLLPAGHEYPAAPSGLFEQLLDNPDVSLLVADEDGELVGYTACGANRDPDVRPEVGEVRSMFVASTHWRAGVGRALLAAAIEDLRRRSYAEATLWSFKANDRANGFYESAGFSRDDAEKSNQRWAHLPEVRYRRSL